MREHEKLAIYPQVKAAAHAVERVARQIPASHADLRSQLRSAFNSVALNLAEGANEYSPAEKARLYRISRRSAGECLAALDLCDAMVPGDVPGAAGPDLDLPDRAHPRPREAGFAVVAPVPRPSPPP